MIRFENVSKDFSGKAGTVHAVKEVSLHIEKGDIFGIIGLSGAGKSTLLRMVNRLESPSTGSVFVEGSDLSLLNNKELRKVRSKIGMIFQQFNLLESKTVYHNIALPLKLQHLSKAEIKERVSRMLSFVELEDKAKTYVSNLSGGQKQRVGIARALATNPSILLCDEATSALDPDTERQLLQNILANHDKTVIFITHRSAVVDYCDQVLRIEKCK